MRQPRENKSDRIPSRHHERREEKEQRLFKRLIEDITLIKTSLDKLTSDVYEIKEALKTVKKDAD